MIRYDKRIDSEANNFEQGVCHAILREFQPSPSTACEKAEAFRAHPSHRVPFGRRVACRSRRGLADWSRCGRRRRQLLAVPPSPENLLSPNSLHDGGKDLLQIFV